MIFVNRNFIVQLTALLQFILAFSACKPGISDEDLILDLLSGKDDTIEKVIRDPDQYKVQILYTQIDRDSLNRPLFTSFEFNVDSTKYFYPASTVKMPTAFLALEKLNELDIPGLDKNTPMITDSAYQGQNKVYTDSTSESGLPSVAHYIKKIFLVSENDAFNRLYEFIGQQELNEKLRAKGYQNTRIVHRLETVLSNEQNRITNPVRFFNGDSLVFSQPMMKYENDFTSKDPILLGKGYLRDGKLVEEPMEFTSKNFFSIRDMQNMLRSVLFPEYVDYSMTFGLTEEDYRFLYQYMSEYPAESAYPSYGEGYYPGYVKFFKFGNSLDFIPENIRIFNKVGDAYGFLIDNAYIVDFDNKIEFFLTAVVHVNKNGIFNDGIYEYDETGFPFFAKLGEIIYTYELERERLYPPDLSKFKLTYN